MDANNAKKRPPRNPLSSEEVAEVIAVKKIREQLKLQKFKKTKLYKHLNIFNIACFFIYCELLFCFFNPCHYQTHYAKKVIVDYGKERNEKNEAIITSLKITDVNNNYYELLVNDYITAPSGNYCAFNIGKDFILQKQIKGGLLTSPKLFRIQRAGPLLFLSAFLVILACIFFWYNLNFSDHSLKAISLINALTMLCFLLI